MLGISLGRLARNLSSHPQEKEVHILNDLYRSLVKSVELGHDQKKWHEEDLPTTPKCRSNDRVSVRLEP
jgi:hypothetical protein